MTANMVGIAALALMTAAVCLILTCGALWHMLVCLFAQEIAVTEQNS